MERITEGQISQLLEFAYARVFDLDALEEVGSRRAAAALRLVVSKQIAAIRYYRVSSDEAAASAEVHATASWNLLVSIAEVWRDHPDFPAGAAIETFEFDDVNPLMPAR